MGMTWGQLSNYLGSHSSKLRIPILGQFELTARCNLQCNMCYVCRGANDRDMIAGEKSAKEWINLAGEAREAGLLYLLLTGGEVFLRKDFTTIYEELSDMGFIRSIYSNGTLITPMIAKWLGNIPPAQIDITLYGASEETYAKVCGDASGFQRAIRGIDLLLEQGINVQVRTTVTYSNRDDFEKLAELTESRGLPLRIVNYISPRRDGCHTYPEMERLSPKDLVEYETRIENYFFDKERSGTQEKNCLSDYTNEEIENNMVLPEDGHPFHCNNGKNSFWITWDGRMIPCSFLDDPAMLPFEKGFLQAWQEMVPACEKIPVCSTCKECSLQDFCMSCPARLKSETGSFVKPASYLCEYAKERYQLLENNMAGGYKNEEIRKAYFRND